VVFPDAGHVYTTDVPDAANQEVLRFLAEIPVLSDSPGTGPPPGAQHGPRSRPAGFDGMTGRCRSSGVQQRSQARFPAHGMAM